VRHCARREGGIAARSVAGLLLAVFGLVRVAAGPLAVPQQLLKDAAERLQQVLREDRLRRQDEVRHLYQVADQVLMPLVDMEQVARLVLGPYWRSATGAQKAAFAEAFKRLLIRTYASALREFGDWEIRFPALQVPLDVERTQIRAEVLRAGIAQPVTLEYRMSRRDGHWRAYDLKIEGISLVTNYRSSFAERIRHRGLDGLIAELVAMNERRARASTPHGGR